MLTRSATSCNSLEDLPGHFFGRWPNATAEAWDHRQLESCSCLKREGRFTTAWRLLLETYPEDDDVIEESKTMEGYWVFAACCQVNQPLLVGLSVCPPFGVNARRNIAGNQRASHNLREG